MLQELTPRLDERQRRLMAGAGARTLGRGGIAAVARATGLSRTTIRKGAIELERGPVAAEDRVRRPGAGRKRATERDPGLVAALEALVDPHTRGDPESPLRWTCKSTRQLADALTAAGHPTSHVRAGELLRSLGYSLQANAKTKEGKQHPDRDAQFRYIQRQAKHFMACGWPVISVDTKKKELVGNYANSGQEWQPSGQPEEVSVHDFPDPDVPKAVPYGVYDENHNLGWVNVGCAHDTARFAVESIRRWWQVM